jgi:MraZ protein
LAILDLFRGSALNAIDGKGRVSIPADFRAAIQSRYRRAVAREGFDPASVEVEGKSRAGKAVSLVKHPEQPCLIAYDDAYAAQYRDEIERRHADKTGVERERAVHRDQRFFGSSEELAWDVNGRVVMSPRLRKRAGIDGVVYYFARGETFELWNPATFCEVHEAEDPDLADECRELCEEKGLTL